VDRISAPGCARSARFSAWLTDSLAGSGRLFCSTEQPRIDAVSVERLFPQGPTEAQAESLRPLMAPGEFGRLRVRKGAA
jgi:hypothetical protein